MFEMWVVGNLLTLALAASGGHAGGVQTVQPASQAREGAEYSGAWEIENVWDAEAEDEFAKWVEAIGLAREQRAFRMAAGLRSPDINPLYTEEDKELRFEADCATLIYSMRAYFAYKTRRPFSFQANKGRRYKAGNRPRVFKNSSQYPDFGRVFRSAMSSVSSGHFRMHATLEGTDTYPVDVSRESIRPGVVYYDPAGHVLLVYRVDSETGEIFMMDGHPDGTLTRKRFNSTFNRGSARFGGGFRAWRHYHIDLSDQETGAVKLVRELNQEAAHYSATAQYRKSYSIDGFELGYHDWVKAMVARDGLYTYPIEGFERRLSAICRDLRVREEVVNAGMDVGMHTKKHPGKMPKNVYRGGPRWKAYSTPALDLKIRAAAVQARGFVVTMMKWAESGDQRLKFEGEASDLYAEYYDAWTSMLESPECTFAYTNSKGDEVVLHVGQVLERLFDLSFDPYNCPELRWGAPILKDNAGSSEFATCPDGKKKLAWYKKETRLRNRTTPLLGRHTPLNRGPSRAPKADIGRLFDCYLAQGPDFLSCHGRRLSGK